MHAVAGGLAGGVQAWHARAAVQVHLHPAHKIVLGGNDGDGLFEHVIPLFPQPRADGGEVFAQRLRPHGPHVQPHELGAVLFHLGADLAGDDVAREQFVAEPVPVLIQKHRPLAAHRFGDEEAPPVLFGIEGGGVDLHIVEVLDLYPAAHGDGERVARQVAVVGGVFEQSPHTAGGKQRIAGINGAKAPVFAADDAAPAGAFGYDDIQKLGVFADLHVGELPHLSQELGSDLFARHVVVEEDARARMPAFAREAEAPLFVAREQHAAADQLVDHGGRTQDHLPHGGLVVLVMAGAHGVFKIAGKVVLPAQHADAALGKEGIAFIRFRLCQHDDAPAARQVERTAQPRHARARDEHVAAVYVHSSVLFHILSLYFLNEEAYRPQQRTPEAVTAARSCGSFFPQNVSLTPYFGMNVRKILPQLQHPLQRPPRRLHQALIHHHFSAPF